MKKRIFFVTLIACLFFAWAYGTYSYCSATLCVTSTTPENAHLFTELGHKLYHKEGKYDESEAVYKRALAADPNFFGALTQLADLLRHRGRYDESEQLFLKALEVDPSQAFTYVDIAKLYRNMKRHDDALAMLKKAEALDPTLPTLWTYGYAGVYKELGELGKAEDAAKKGIALDADDYFGYHALGDVLSSEKKYTEAEDAYLKSLSLSPRSESSFALGWLFLYQDKLDQAEYWFNEYNNTQPTPRAEVYVGLAKIAEKRGDSEKAEQDYEYAHYLDQTMGK